MRMELKIGRQTMTVRENLVDRVVCYFDPVKGPALSSPHHVRHRWRLYWRVQVPEGFEPVDHQGE